ncbi:(d)CMP kinase [Dinoroseobacter sp. S124A]|uniref:(d)CMP kinase n=1 Tax=Dinoroseobacter sp. S124A TaxID=3415128 RepID=UPI003C7CFD7D
MNFAIAIDGPAAAGKGTIGRAMAARFGFPHMDTGLLYRAVGKKVLTGADATAAARALTTADLEAGDLRTAEVGQAASKVAALPAVRTALLDFQRAFAQRAGGAILDGRDIGTVICPDAAVKLFVTASDEVRAQRRHAELSAKGSDLSLAQVLADLRARDARDTQRSDAPLRAAEDALLLDTSQLSIEDAVAQAVALAETRMNALQFIPSALN